MIALNNLRDMPTGRRVIAFRRNGQIVVGVRLHSLFIADGMTLILSELAGWQPLPFPPFGVPLDPQGYYGLT